jgi:drug/metabolite transporter, DME family
LFSTAGAALKSSSLDTWEVAGARAALAALTVAALVKGARRGWTWAVAPVAAAYAVTGIMFVAANKATTAASTIFLQSTSPLYIALLGYWLLGERVRRRDVAFMAALAAGLGLLLAGAPTPQRTAPDPARGNLLAALCAVTLSLMLVGLRWLGRSGVGAGSAPAAVVLGNLMIVAVAMPQAWPIGRIGLADALTLAWLGVFQIGVAYVLMLEGLRHVPTLEASLLMFIEPVLSPVWAWLLHGEVPGPWVLAGGTVILVATALNMAYDAWGRRAV